MSKNLLLEQTYWPDDDEETMFERAVRLWDMVYDKHDFPVKVTVKRYVRERRDEAHNYLWGVCYAMMSEASGYTKEEIHSAMCSSFFGTKTIRVGSHFTEAPIRTSTINEDGEPERLDEKTMAELIEHVVYEAATWFGISIPPPKKQDTRP